MQADDGQGAATSGYHGIRRSVPPEAGAVVRPSDAPGPMGLGGQGAPARGPAHSVPPPTPTAAPFAARVNIPAEEADARIKAEALRRMRAGGLAIDAIRFAATATVRKLRDGGATVEVAL